MIRRRGTPVTPAEIAGRHTVPMKDDLRAAPEDYTQLAKRCVELASECSEPTVAEALRALAVDYLARAARLRHANQSSRQGRHRTGRPKRLAVQRRA
jgi:hypothetical protein